MPPLKWSSAVFRKTEEDLRDQRPITFLFGNLNQRLKQQATYALTFVIRRHIDRNFAYAAIDMPGGGRAYPGPTGNAFVILENPSKPAV